MTSSLASQDCVPCRGTEPALTPAEIAALKPHVPDWSVVEYEGIPRLERTFKFKDFAAALAFADRVGALAEAQDHHPRIVTEWGKTTVQWWTHSIEGLHHNDFIMAARTDTLFRP